MRKSIIRKSMVLISFAAIILLFCLNSCLSDNADAKKDYDDMVITLERTACFGTCPVYRLIIHGEGTVIYEGRDFVDTKGMIETSISKESVEELVLEFEKADYFSLNNDYIEREITDAPSVITSIEIGEKSKTIEHYHGDLSAPERLSRLEDRIDEIVNSSQWTKR